MLVSALEVSGPTDGGRDDVGIDVPIRGDLDTDLTDERKLP